MGFDDRLRVAEAATDRCSQESSEMAPRSIREDLQIVRGNQELLAAAGDRRLRWYSPASSTSRRCLGQRPSRRG